MAIPLIVLAIGSVVAGYVGVPHALGGSNWIETFLHPAFEAHQRRTRPRPRDDAGEPVAAPGGCRQRRGGPRGRRTELMLMGLSVGSRLPASASPDYFWLRQPVGRRPAWRAA